MCRPRSWFVFATPHKPSRERPHLTRARRALARNCRVAHALVCQSVIERCDRRRLVPGMRRAPEYDRLTIQAQFAVGSVTHFDAFVVAAIPRPILSLCSAPSTLCASLRPRVPRGLRALTAPARSRDRHLRDGRNLYAPTAIYFSIGRQSLSRVSPAALCCFAIEQ